MLSKIFKRKNVKKQKIVSELIRAREIQMYLDIYYTIFRFFYDLKTSMGITMYQDIVAETNKWCLRRIKNRQDLYKLHKLFVSKKGV